jgi:hypothetical protein
MAGYWYLATPYSDYPGGHQAACEMACEQAALLIAAGVDVFCPIAHSHPIAEHGNLDKVDPELWRRVDKPFVEAAKGCIYLEDPASLASKGMHNELIEFVKAGKPVVFMQPGVVPPELLSIAPSSFTNIVWSSPIAAGWDVV